MSTVLKLGSADHGRPMTFEEFLDGSYEEDFQYEIIEGRLYVTPAPNLPHDRITTFIYRQLIHYSEQHPDIINYVTQKARVLVDLETGFTSPEPDIAVYQNFPENFQAGWRDVHPLLVVEVLGAHDEEKDLHRNVDLYLSVPSIQEYWVFDIRQHLAKPTLHVYRRQNENWDISIHDASEVYKTQLLPEFSLAIGLTDSK